MKARIGSMWSTAIGKRQYERHSGSAEQRYLFCSVFLQRRRWAPCRRLDRRSSRYAEPNANSYSYSNCNSNCYAYCYSYRDGYCYCNTHTNGHSDAHGNACAYAYADAYPETHACAKRYA